MKEVNYRVKGTEMFWNNPEGAEAILQVRAAALCDQRFPEEPKYLQDKDLRVHYFAKKSLSWYAPNIRP